jgi:hypothetical protein
MASRIILTSDETIKCPQCGHEFPLREGIATQTIERYAEEFDTALAGERDALRLQLEKDIRKQAEKSFTSRIEELMEKLERSEGAARRAQGQLTEARDKAAAEARAEAEVKSAALEKELEQKEKKLAEFRDQELTLRQDKKRLEESRRDMELQLQRRLDEEKTRLEQKSAEDFRLKEAEYRKKIEDAQKANEALKRKLEQGSQQLQGEVLELEMEGLLSAAFPFDTVEEVRKGQRGADVVHTVCTRNGTDCGKIVWESKRAENWSGAWIPKLKDDQQNIHAEIAVLVSTAFPFATQEPFVQHEGIWVVRPHAIRPVAEALRTVLIEAQKQRIISSGRNEKMEAMYDYLCSPPFAQKIRGVVDAYQAMRDDLEKEKAAMMRLWKKRETQLERITSNMMGMCGELQGIAEDSLPSLDFAGSLPVLDDDS